MEKLRYSEDLSFSEKLLEEMKKIKPMSRKEYEKWQCEVANDVVGNLTGYDCHECKNRGYFTKLDEYGNQIVSECRCMIIRRAKMRIANSGLINPEEKTFSSFETPENWQKQLKNAAAEYVCENSGKWLFIGGQSGGGKTHLCTAVCLELIKKGRDVHYVLWRDLLHELESLRYEYDRYSYKMNCLKDYDVLYIDDFLKSIDDGRKIQGLNYAFELINYRYSANKLTIISSELLENEIRKLDTALHGRIVERSGKYIFNIPRSENKNFRLKQE